MRCHPIASGQWDQWGALKTNKVGVGSSRAAVLGLSLSQRLGPESFHPYTPCCHSLLLLWMYLGQAKINFMGI